MRAMVEGREWVEEVRAVVEGKRVGGSEGHD